MDWSYVAGFFDGEGSIHKDKKSNSWTVQLTQKDREVLDQIREFLINHSISPVGIYYRLNGKTINDKHFDIHILIFSKRANVIRFFQAVLPYLIVKKAKAKEALIYLMKVEEKNQSWKNRLKGLKS